MQLLQFVVLAGLRVVIDDGAVVDGHPTDIDTVERELRLRLGFRFFFRLVLLQVNQVLPVGDARFVLRQIQMQAIERDRIDLDLLIEQQWQQLDPNLDLLDLGERLLAKTSRIAETRVRKLHAQPWKHAQLDIAKREFAAGFLLNLVLDLAAIVVRIKQQRDRDQRGDDEQHKAADDEKNDFQRLGHERTLNGSIGDIVVQCRKSGRTRHEEASTAANRLHDQQFVAVTYMSVGMPRARHDDAIVLDRDPFATEIQKFEQLGQ